MKLRDLRNGATFVTADGTYGVKSEHSLPEQYYIPTAENMEPQNLCINIKDGHYLIFPEGNDTIVTEVSLVTEPVNLEHLAIVEDRSIEQRILAGDYSWEQAKKDKVILYAETEDRGIVYLYPDDVLGFRSDTPSERFIHNMQVTCPEARLVKVPCKIVTNTEMQRAKEKFNA